MTPGASSFVANFGSVADQVAAGTGLSRWALLVQWANETSLGTQIFNRNNLGNIRCSPTTFCQYATLNDFANAAIATWHNGSYTAALATSGQTVHNQLLAIGASPWDAGHYGLAECGYAGCALVALWQSNFDSVEDNPRPRRRVTIMATQDSINMFTRGVDNALWHNRFDGTAWSGWKSLGGGLGTADIIAMRGLTRLDVFVVGVDNAMYGIGSTDDGVTWSGFQNLGGNMSNGVLAAVGSPALVAGTQVDLGPLQTQVAGLTGTVTKIESAVVKAGASLQQA